MKKYRYFSIEQFATDSDFIKWVIDADASSNKFWKKVIEDYPEQKRNIEEAVKLILSIQAVEEPILKERLDLTWERIRNTEKSSTAKIKLHQISLRWVAVMLLLIGISFIVTRIVIVDKSNIEIVETEILQIEDAKVILPDGSEKTINNSESQIDVKSTGEIIVDNDTLKSSVEKNKNANLVKVIMPFGKQSKLLLPDGSTVYINAGSQLSFPSEFTKKTRDVYLIGEAFFEIEKNENQPFVVKTSDVDITVTGTEFNVSAYSDDNIVQTILVAGGVSLSKKSAFSKTIEIKPGEGAFFNKTEDKISINNVDTNKYTAWINGYIVCDQDKMTEIIKKIERFYNKEIIIDETIQEITYSGKLDLNNSISSILESLTYTTPLAIEYNDETILIKNKNL